MPGWEVLSPGGSDSIQLPLKPAHTPLLNTTHTHSHGTLIHIFFERLSQNIPLNTELELFFNPACVTPGFSFREAMAGEGHFGNVRHLVALFRHSLQLTCLNLPRSDNRCGKWMRDETRAYHVKKSHTLSCSPSAGLSEAHEDKRQRCVNARWT